MPSITKRAVDRAKPAEGPVFLWDSEVKGFGLLVLPSGVKSFVVQYRNAGGRSRRYTLGRYGPLTADQARAAAKLALGAVARGGDPVKERQAMRAAPTCSELLDRYVSEHAEVHNAESFRKEIKRVVETYLKPAIGTMKAAEISTGDLAKLHSKMKSTPRQANVALAIASKAFALAETWQIRPANSNPAKGIGRFKEAERDRFLSEGELARLGAALSEAEADGLPWRIKAEGSKHLPQGAAEQRTPVNVAALRAIALLLFTGARLSEILSLEWVHVDLKAGTVALPSRKGDGRRPHPVGSEVVDILTQLKPPRRAKWVLPRAGDAKRHISKEVVETTWQRVRWRAQLEDVRLHDLRHTVGTYAGEFGNAFLISHLLRHRNVAVTSRYVNPDADPIRRMSESVGGRIKAGLRGKPL